jgi:hypothetical protein
MMHPNEIARMSREASARSARQRTAPLVVEQEDLQLGDEALLTFLRRAPFLGSSYTPKGWVLVQELFVDSTGFGYDTEPALSHRQLVEKVRELGPGKGYGITEAGQFQVYLGVYGRQ